MNLFEKIHAISQKIGYLEKDMTIGTGTNAYRAISDTKVLKAVNEAENEFNVHSFVESVTPLHRETLRVAGRDKDTLIRECAVQIVVRVVDLDVVFEKENPLSTYIITAVGEGVDYGDKAMGKATTYARKYARLNLYNIPTGEDPDQSASEPLQTLEPSEKRAFISDFYEKNPKRLAEVLKHFGVDNLAEISKSDVNTLYAALTDKKK